MALGERRAGIGEPRARGAAMEPNQHSPLYGISVAAELSGVNPQMLRAYEARGLLDPYRTDGGTRRYSDHDLQIVARITALLSGGLNLAGIEQVLHLEAENRRLRAEIDRLRARGTSS
jgi:MerR family transcriptional regulator/heat shock protein HspR